MGLESPLDAMPWVGLYTAVASLICTLAMAADLVRGFWQWKLWFPNRFFTLNAATLTLIAIAMKLPVDLTTEMSRIEVSTAKNCSIFFLVIMLANFLPSLGLMNDKELLMNIVALEILVITIVVNILIQIYTHALFVPFIPILIFPILWPFSVAMAASTSRKKLEHQYKELQGLVSCRQDKWFSYKELRCYVKKYWMMVESCDPQLVIAYSPVSSACGDICSGLAIISEETHYCWSLILVTLTAIAIALPHIGNDRCKWLLDSMREGLQFVRHVEECFNADGDLVNARKTARHAWTEVEIYGTWQQIDLQKKAREGKTSKEILKWLGHEAAKNVIRFKSNKSPGIDYSPNKFTLASSMYRISETMLLYCNEKENWPCDDELFQWISTVIADLLVACFTNLEHVIKVKCHHHEIGKRGHNIRIAAQLLGKSKKILKILKARQLPDIDQDSMAYIDKWRVLSTSQLSNDFHIPNDGDLLARVQRGSSSFNVSHIVTIM